MMYRRIAAAALVLAALCASLPASRAGANDAGEGRSAEKDGEYRLAVTGLTAETKKSVEEALGKLAHAKSVTADPAAGTVVVTMEGDAVLDAAAVAKALEPTGVQVARLEAPAGSEVVWYMTYSGGGG